MAKKSVRINARPVYMLRPKTKKAVAVLRRTISAFLGNQYTTGIHACKPAIRFVNGVPVDRYGRVHIGHVHVSHVSPCTFPIRFF